LFTEPLLSIAAYLAKQWLCMPQYVWCGAQLNAGTTVPLPLPTSFAEAEGSCCLWEHALVKRELRMCKSKSKATFLQYLRATP
jgi:hypothetical protein